MGKPLLLWARMVAALMLSCGSHAFMRKPNNAGERPSAMWMSAVELIERSGFACETHRVRTADGYLLEMHRILPRAVGDASNASSSSHGTPVLAGHGMFATSEQWLIRERDNLVLILVDRGFDVWLANYRGSFYSRRHDTLSVRDSGFWNFSWHENGVSDQAAMIDHVLETTRRPALATLGYSLGGTVQLVLLAQRPEYAARTLGNVMMAPPVYNGEELDVGWMAWVRAALKKYPWLSLSTTSQIGNQGVAREPAPLLCYPTWPPKALNPFCKRILDVVIGLADEDHMNHTVLAISFAHLPAGAGLRQVLHYGQNIEAGAFRMYNFGPEENMRLYGCSEPPPYNLSRVDAPVFLYYSATDNTVPSRTTEKLAEELPAVNRKHGISHRLFNHFDFMVHDDAYDIVYRYVIDDLMGLIGTK